MSHVRPVGPWTASALVAASMIGTGVFTTSGYALADLGSREAVLVAWALGALYAAAGAISYLWLIQAHPVDGGEAALLERTWHPVLGAAAGWISLAAGFTAPIAAAALALDAYLGTRGLGLAAIALAAVLHALPGTGRHAQTAAVGLKVALLVAGIGLAWQAVAPVSDPTTLADADWSRLGPTVVWVTFAFSGWNAFVYVGGQLSASARRAPVVLAGVGAVAALYLGVNAAILYAAPVESLAGRPDVAVAAVESLGVPALVHGLRPVVGLALFTSITAMVWTGAEVWRYLARAGQLPAALQGPRVALAAQAGAGMVAATVSVLRDLLGYIGLTLGVSAAVTVAGLFAMHLRDGVRPASRGYPLLPLGFVVATLLGAAWMAWREPLPALVSALTLLAALFAGWLRPPRGGSRPHGDSREAHGSRSAHGVSPGAHGGSPMAHGDPRG